MDNENIHSCAFNFSGSIPQHYEQCQGPMFFEPYAIEIAKRIDPSLVHVALEIGCGTGRVTRHLRNVIPAAARLVASDISPDMLEVAKEKLNAMDIEWRIIDAEQLPFDDDSINLLVCCFAYMFVPDKPQAFAEAYRVLKPGGMLLFSTWDKLKFNAASYIYRQAVKKYFGSALPELYNLPFSMNDPVAIKEILQHAGFSKIAIESVDKVSICNTASEAADGLAHGGAIYNEIMQRNPAWIEEIISTVEKELAEKFGTAPMIAPMRAVVSKAWK